MASRRVVARFWRGQDVVLGWGLDTVVLWLPVKFRVRLLAFSPCPAFISLGGFFNLSFTFFIKCRA